ncbi:RHS repeat-associated core domain-containing protein [Streptomyces parvus]|uniref:RHS repeat-associated core domain-containing protein n=1 Tax=Streptomyces parvus TaxID=66428 RepID=UPI0034110C58
MHSEAERFGLRVLRRGRVLAVGVLALAMAMGTVPAAAAPSGPPRTDRASAVTAPPPEEDASVDAAGVGPVVDDAVYAHDAEGRLVGVTDPQGETARYRYDAAGNRLGVDRFSSSTLSVLSMVPVRAPAGATVTLSGTGFADTAATNVVTFGAARAEVTSASATRLTVKVPAGAENGQVTVASGGATATSPETFTLASPGPSITGLTPASGTAGTEVVLAGGGFASTITNNVVRFGGGDVAHVTGRTDTALTVRVPPGAKNGPVEIETPDGVATSAASFQVRSAEGVVESSEATTVTDETPPTVSVTTPGNRAEVLFDAEAGDDFTFGFTGSTFNQSVRLSLIGPDGTQVGSSGSVSGAVSDWEVAEVPLAGRYALRLEPGTGNIGAVTVTLSHPVEGELALEGPAAEARVTRLGQDAQWTFDAARGESLSVGIDAAEMSESLTARLYGPDGTQLESGNVSAGSAASIDVDALPDSGRYRLYADLRTEATGVLTVTGSHYADAGTLETAGPDLVLPIERPGQNGVARFAAEAGQRMSLGVAASAFTSSYNSIDVAAPDGSRLERFSVSANGTTEWDSAPLPASGTYTITVDPGSAGTGTLRLTLSQPASAPQLTTVAAPTRVEIARLGQDVQTSFVAEAGDDLSLAVASDTFTGYVHASVFDPSGATVVDRAYMSAGGAAIGLSRLPASGAYRVVIDPYGGNTGSLDLTLSADVSVALSLEGPSVPLLLARSGQRARGVFAATAGDDLTVGLTGNGLDVAAYVSVYAPSGAKVVNSSYVGAGSSAVIALPDAPESGDYTVLVENDRAGSGSMTLTLSSDVRVVLSVDGGGVPVEVVRPGQRVRASFVAGAGDDVSLGLSENGFASAVFVSVFAPSGAKVVNRKYVSSSSAVSVALSDLPEAGDYTVMVESDAAETGSFLLTLSSDVRVVLSVDGGGVPVEVVRPGQRVRASFVAGAGDDVSLGLSENGFASAVYVSVFAPSGAKVVNRRYVGSGNAVSVALPDLPETGDYTVMVESDVAGTGSLTLGLITLANAWSATGVGQESPWFFDSRSSSPSEGKITKERRKSPSSDKPRGPKPSSAPRSLAEPKPRVVPDGPDAWQPGRANLSGRDWITARGKTPELRPALRAPERSTALTGHVLKLDGRPLPDVSVSVGRKTTRTDAHGRFVLSGVSPRATTVVVDGSSANTAKRQYGRFDIRVELVAGRTTDLGFPVWMTPLDTKHTVTFDAPAKADVVLKTPQIPGLEVRIPKGSVVRDEKGKPVTELGITAIPIDRPPFPLPKSSVVPVYFTVQPGGTYVFPDGAQVIYPNYTEEAPGTRVEFMDYDPKKKGWYVYGHGRVSADGRQVVPDADTRVWAFHGAMFNIGDLVPWATSWLQDALDWLSGDPVQLSTGMLTDSRTDLAVADPRGSADVTRTYWQGDTRKRSFGIGRDLSYNAFLHSEKQYQEVDLYLPGGSKVHFTRTSPGTGYRDAVFEPLDTPSGFRGSKIVNADGMWELQLRGGAVWVFPQYSPLKEIRDRHGNSLSLERLSGSKGEITRIVTSGGRWISLAYDAEHRVKEAKDNTGRTVAYTYDGSGRLETVTDPAGHVARYTYDGTSNRVATATDARGITYMTNTFDADGRVEEQILTEGARYAFAYTEDSSGRITATEVTQPGGAVRRVAFDANGFGTSDTEAHGTDLARTTSYERDEHHRVSAVTDPHGRRTELTYDTNGHVTRTTELAGTPDARSSGTVALDGPFDQPTSSTDPLGNATTFGYDDSGNLSTVTDPEDRTTTFTHTADGQFESVTDASGAVTEFGYRHGELISVKDAEGRRSSQFVDAAGRPTTLTDAAGARTTFAYDQQNQLRKVTGPLGHELTYGYDENGNLTSLTDARNNATTWTYDDADRPRTVTDPLGVQAGFGYDAVGRLTKATSRSGKIATAEYDLLGRIEQARYGVDATGSAESTATYAYDAVDLLKQITDTESGTQSFIYDALDRLRSTTGPTGTVGYAYDDADRRTQLTAAGLTTEYGYDKSSILTSITTGTRGVTFAPDATGRIEQTNLPGGITRTTGYDKTGAIASLSYDRGETKVGDLTYARDARGLQSRLNGSLAQITLPAAETGSAFDEANRLTRYGGRTLSYDKDGQLTSDGIRDYTWNARGQLTGLGKPGQTSQFGYDPLGTRNAKTIGGATGTFLTDGSNPLVEQGPEGQPSATITASGVDEFLTRVAGGQTQIYLTDALGSVMGLANEDGTVATRYAYDPNGVPAASGEASSNPYTFTGREDDGTGLMYYRARYYDPQTGRFVSQDPIGHDGGANLYQYALGNPTTYTDPSGNIAFVPIVVVAASTLGYMGHQRLTGRKITWQGTMEAATFGTCVAYSLGTCALASFAGVGAKYGYDYFDVGPQDAKNNAVANTQGALLGLFFGKIGNTTLVHMGRKWGLQKYIPQGRHRSAGNGRHARPTGKHALRIDRFGQGLGYGLASVFGVEGCGISTFKPTWCEL